MIEGLPSRAESERRIGRAQYEQLLVGVGERIDRLRTGDDLYKFLGEFGWREEEITFFRQQVANAKRLQ